MSDTGNETPDEQTTGPTTIPDEERDPLQEGAPPEDETEDETGEDEEQTGEEPPAKPAEADVRTDKEMEKVFRDIDRLRKDVAGRVGRIFGDDAVGLMDCPLCAAVAPGYMWPPDVAPLADEQITAIRLLLNMPVATNYEKSPFHRQCPTCKGKGQLDTDSQVQNEELVICPTCKHRGWVFTELAAPTGERANGSGEKSQTTGPTVYGDELVTVEKETDPAIQALRERGYLVVEPLAAPRPVAP